MAAHALHFGCGDSRAQGSWSVAGTDRVEDHAVGVDAGRTLRARGEVGAEYGELRAEFQDVDQQKCTGHILRNVANVVETKQGRAREFGVPTKGLLQEDMELWRTRASLTADVFAEKAFGRTDQ
jgi:hypothetical protein